MGGSVGFAAIENQKQEMDFPKAVMEPIASITAGASLRRVGLICGLWAGSLFLVLPSVAADFSVTSPGFFYSINGASPNPALKVERGKTYIFAINTAAGHPFEILSAGVSNNNISSGTITWTVPLAATNYHYRCSIHGFGNQIMTVPAARLPTISIVAFSISTNIMLLSTGTDTWSVLPEFNTNLAVTNWYALTIQTNRFSNGTNETICGRPPGNPIFIRIRSAPR
jgi:hypothetical protein